MNIIDEREECFLSRRRTGQLVSAFLKVVNHRPEEVQVTFPWGRNERLTSEESVNVWVPHRYWKYLKNKAPRPIKADGESVELIHFAGIDRPGSGPAWKVRFALDLVGG